MSSDVHANNRVWRKIYNTVRRVDGASVRVGPQNGENAAIGLIHEFGAPGAGIPARSFIGQTFVNRRSELVAIQAKIAKGILEGKLDEKKAMELLGAWAAGAIKATITRDGTFVPLKPATIKRKGSDKPLIHTGQLVGSITFMVVP